jgi:hypothetical protein
MIGETNASAGDGGATASIVSATILGVTGSWLKEVFADGLIRFERVTSIADPSEVAVRTSSDGGTTLTAWSYSYAVWKV